jgi:transcriptional regulator with XRE-family HTH domain
MFLCFLANNIHGFDLPYLASYAVFPVLPIEVMMWDMEDNKNNLRDIRVSLGLKQTDVAAMLGHASPDRISHWEKGVAFPGVVNLFKLSLIYRVPPEQMYADLYQSLANKLQQKNGSKSELGSNPFLVQNGVCGTKAPERLKNAWKS